MGDNTKIQWTEASWSVNRGCSRISPGCGASDGGGCYAESMAYRFSSPGQPYHGFVRAGKNGPRWTSNVALMEDKLDQPKRWRRPRMIFVNSMSDTFHENLSDEQILRVFNSMFDAPHHTYQVLTKRAARMAEFVKRHYPNGLPSFIWLGVSVENQEYAEKRIPLLLEAPAAIRFLSVEPLLGPVNLGNWLTGSADCSDCGRGISFDEDGCCSMCGADADLHYPIDWIIIGGESGRGARPCHVEWIRSIVRQCRAAQTACFVKQLGANVIDRNDAGFDGNEEDSWDLEGDFDAIEYDPNGFHEEYQGAPVRIRLRDPKGGDIEEFPKDLRIREFPTINGEER